MEAKNTVKVKNVNGDLLETEHLIWNEKTEMIYTEEFVKITTKKRGDLWERFGFKSRFYKIYNKKISGTIMLTHIDE